MSSKENRRAPRTKTDLVFEIFGHADQFISGVGRLLDVSIVGGLLETTSRLDTGQKIKAQIRIDERRVVELEGNVVWLRPKGRMIVYGIEFIRMHPNDLERLKTWMEARV